MLTKAVAMATHKLSIQHIAATLGYGPNAFSAMVRKTMGMPPSRFFGLHEELKDSP